MIRARGRAIVAAACLAVFAACSAAAPGGPTTADPDRDLATIRRDVVAHAPYKQWNLATGRPNMEIGRAPGAACEAISYLAADWRITRSPVARDKAVELAAWIVELQNRSAALPIPGGVPSTPDLPAPQNTYHYAVDAAFCGTAMLDLAESVPDPRWTRSASTFGRFLLSMMRNANGLPNARTGSRGLCEAVVQTPGQAAWNCRRYVKNLIALPLMARLRTAGGGRAYADAAADVRRTLVPGLKGWWEYSEGPVASPTWHRVEGPHHEPDHFVYGDTMAYGVRGLHAFEGGSPDVVGVYRDLTDARRHEGRTRSYDPRFALSGYVVGRTRTADPASAYYDLVTLGLLQPVRAEIAPSDHAAAAAVLRGDVVGLKAIGWHMDMSRRVRTTGMGDISTLAALGEAVLGAGVRTTGR